EVSIGFKLRILFAQLCQHRTPESPGTHLQVKLFQHFHIIRLGGQGSTHAHHETCYEQEGEGVDRLNIGKDQRQCDGEAGYHTPEVTKSVEAPPVPLEHVGCSVGTEEGAHDPLNHRVQRRNKQADAHSEDHKDHRDGITKIDVFFSVCIGIDVALVNIEIGRAHV